MSSWTHPWVISVGVPVLVRPDRGGVEYWVPSFGLFGHEDDLEKAHKAAVLAIEVQLVRLHGIGIGFSPAHA